MKPFSQKYNPDVLNCIANLSNDEVFTPPSIANKMLDILPQSIFSDPNVKFLDPFCKSGVFLREIVKRLDKGLLSVIPDTEERINHILKNQVFGMAITELTSLLSRRTLYCSKKANGPQSVAKFTSADGNIYYKPMHHTWVGGKCKYCGASQSVYDRDDDSETYAYNFIHITDIKKIFNMKFDVIIGNPPYQLNDGGAQASAIPIYNLFVEQSIRLDPKYLVMITPSRWFSGGRGLDSFREFMLMDSKISVIHDFPNASDCFNGVEIKGGVSYFLWENKKTELCDVYTHEGESVVSHARRRLLESNCDIFIRNNRLVSIYKKVLDYNEKPFSEIVSSMKPYGLRGDFIKNPGKYNLPEISKRTIENGYKIYGLDEKLKRTVRYVKKDYPIPNKNLIEGYKIFMARNQGSGIIGEVLSTPIFAKPGECCTETFVVIGIFETEKEMLNCYGYMKTKFFRTMLAIRKNDQGCGQNVYKSIPLQNFSEPWTDEKLYKKYNLSKEEIDFIESVIRPME